MLPSLRREASGPDAGPQPPGRGDAQQTPRLEDVIDRLNRMAPPLPSRQPIPPDLRGPPPRVPAKDPVPREAQGRPLIPEHTPDPAKVQILVECYNAAARAALGPRAPRAFGSSDPERSKHYPALLRAAEALVEHDIAPRAWADWRLDFAKKTRRHMGVTQVFQAATIVKLRGYFRRNHDLEGGVRSRPERYHFEQMFREREAWKRWEWGDMPDGSSGITAEPWYYEMRRRERAEGHLDPLDLWPSKLGPRKGG